MNRMRYILPALLCLLLTAGAVASYAQTDPQLQNDVAPEDSTLNVIGYFSKGDTLIYWINESDWRLTPSDTVKAAGVSTKVRLNVVDSTPQGYKMEYTFLEFRGDSIANSSLGSFQNTIAEKLGRKIVGTTIRFETDEYGTITRFDNLDKIKRQAKSLFKEAMKDLMKISEIAGLKKEFGVDIKNMMKDVDADALVEGYIEELKLIFLCHGLSFDIGESHIHEDATESSYENDTYRTVSLDPDDGSYSIRTEVINIIPQSEVKDMVGRLVGMMNDESATESFNKEFDSQVNVDALYSSYFSSDYVAHGWPYRIVRQTATTINGRGKSNQKYIYLDYINY